LSCSYGPGRYQPNYEEKGLDYPIGHVRWTEGRNMSEFLRMVAEGKVAVRPLISVHRPVEKAQEAYDAILGKDSDAISAVIDYGASKERGKSGLERKVMVSALQPSRGRVGVAVVGAGGFASAFHLPNTARMEEARLVAVCDAVGAKAKQAAEKHGAAYCTGDYREVLSDDKVDAVIVATRHHLHKPIALQAIKAGKHVFVEKPLAITVADCETLCKAVEKAGVLLSVGFNRRFSRFSRQAKALLPQLNGPKMILYRCNAGVLPPDHWTMDPEIGGGRIVGEGVHFFDLCCWLLDQDPVDIRADRVDAESPAVNAADNVSATLRYPDGSLATILYCCVGHPSVSKETIEVFGDGKAIVIDDFRSIRFAGLAEKNQRQAAEHKGQYELLHNWIRAIRGEESLSVTVQHGRRATFIAQEVLRKCHSPDAAR
jgi:predicted dehydrogenase